MNDFLDSPAAKRLIKMGLMDAETGATRRAKATSCGKCRRHVMRGIDADWSGRTIDADPEPLTALGEALALMSGRRTVSLTWLGDRYQIDDRNASRIRGSPAGTLNMDVLVVHQCDLAIGFPLPSMNSTLNDSVVVAQLPIDPPF